MHSEGPVADFRTERLSIRHWKPTLTDRDARMVLEVELSSVLTDDVLEHLPQPLKLLPGTQNVSDWIDARDDESHVMLVRDLTTQQLCGLLILACFESGGHPTEIHVGYLFAKRAWGKGYATELLNGLVQSFEGRGDVVLVGGVDIQNVASARVLEKAGFRLDPKRTSGDVQFFVLRLT